MATGAFCLLQQSHCGSVKSDSMPVATVAGCLTARGACTKVMSEKPKPGKARVTVASQPTCYV